MARKGISGLLVVAWLLSACALLQTPAPSPMPGVEATIVAMETAVATEEAVFQKPTATPPTLTVTPLPGKAFFRGISSYDLTRRFTLLYSLDTWQRDGGWLRHQSIPGCALYPEAGGMGLEPEVWSKTEDWVTLGGWNLERGTFTQEGYTVPGLVCYGLTTDKTYFLFQLSLWDLDQATFDRCRADAETVLATFTALESLSGEFAITRAALDVYEPPQEPERAASGLAGDVAGWLSQGNDLSGLTTLLRTLPKLDTTQPEVTLLDLNGDGRRDVVVQTQLMGLPVIACLAQENGRFIGQPLPSSFGEPLPTVDSGVLVQELTGDTQPETVITYTVQGGSGWTELLYAFRWGDFGTPGLIFYARLLNWAGLSTWAFEPNPAHSGQQQIVLTYPHLYSDGFDHKMINHPLGRQVWRWDESTGRFELAEKTVDMEHSGWRPEGLPITVEDRLRWFTNEGEAVFRFGEYDQALTWYGKVQALAASEGWIPARDQPDWAGYARFRRAEILALPGRPDEALTEMQAVAADYTDDMLGELAAAFLSGYGDGSVLDASARGVAAMQAVDLYSHLYGRGGALCFPMDAAGILYPGAGLAAYLDAHPERLGDAEVLLAGLQEAGFSAENVQLENADDVTGGKVVIALRLPDAPNAGGALVEWTFICPTGHWQVAPPASVESISEWPFVGGF